MEVEIIKLGYLFQILFLILAITIATPILIVTQFSHSDKHKETLPVKYTQTQIKKDTEENPSEPAVEVSVYRNQLNTIENIPLEDYVVGTVASEMPANFEKEALKAQALTARTYIIKKMSSEDRLGATKETPIIDTTQEQVYKNKKELKEQWGKNYSKNIKKIKEAVKETNNQILTYNNNPIEATFFSASNGYTENSEEYWSQKIPYLRSVHSKWDLKAPNFVYHMQLKNRETY